MGPSGPWGRVSGQGTEWASCSWAANLPLQVQTGSYLGSRKTGPLSGWGSWGWLGDTGISRSARTPAVQLQAQVVGSAHHTDQYPRQRPCSLQWSLCQEPGLC